MTKVIYYTTENGDNPVSDFLDKLEKSQQTKLLRVINYIEVYGLHSVLPHLKRLTGTSLWEIRILGKDNLRILYVLIHEDEVLLLHGFVKKVQKAPRREIDIALNRFKEWVTRTGS